LRLERFVIRRHTLRNFSHMYFYFMGWLVSFCCFCAFPLCAQTTVLDKNLQLKTPIQVRLNHTQTSTGSKGISISWEAAYVSKKNKTAAIIPFLVKLRLYEQNKTIFTDNTQLLAVRNNPKNPQLLELFIPYRSIDLPAGAHTGLRLGLEIPNLLEFSTQLAEFYQPERFKVRLAFKAAAVKQQLEEWDASEAPYDWKPDPYWGIYLNDAVKPVFRTPPYPNQYQLPPLQADFFVCAGDNIRLKFWEEDGEKDTLLAIFDLPACLGDAQFPAYALMQDNIKGLAYLLEYQQLIQQPITLKVDGAAEKNGVKFVRIDAISNLAKTHKGKKARPVFVFKDKDGNVLKLPKIAQNLPIQALETDNLYSLWIPFYDWNPQTYRIEFAWQTDAGDALKSSPFILLNPINFPAWVQYARISGVQEQVLYHKAQGVRFSVVYKLNPQYKTGGLNIGLAPVKDSLSIFWMQKNGQPRLLTQPKFTYKKAPESDSISFFIPYSGLTERLELRLSLSFGIDSSNAQTLVGIPDTLLSFKLPNQLKEVFLSQESVLDICTDGDYGKTVQIRYMVPELLRAKNQLYVKAFRNGELLAPQMFRLVGCDSLPCPIVSDTGGLALVFPYRYLQAQDSLKIWVWAADKRGRPASDTLGLTARLPEQLFTDSLVLAFQTLEIDPKAFPKDTNETALGWMYRVDVGSQQVAKIPLPALLKYSKKTLQSLAVSLAAQREDKIHIYLQRQDSSQRKLSIWKGDIDKLNLDKSRILVQKRYPIQKAVWRGYPARVARRSWKKFLFGLGFR
jgi:hypothetical protein